ncbi:protein of unknown function [Pararobbsia alpina]
MFTVRQTSFQTSFTGKSCRFEQVSRQVITLRSKLRDTQSKKTLCRVYLMFTKSPPVRNTVKKETRRNGR